MLLRKVETVILTIMNTITIISLHGFIFINSMIKKEKNINLPCTVSGHDPRLLFHYQIGEYPIKIPKWLGSVLPYTIVSTIMIITQPYCIVCH